MLRRMWRISDSNAEIFGEAGKWRISDSNAEIFRRSGNTIENKYYSIPATVL